MDKETYQALKRIIDRLRLMSEDDAIEHDAGWMDELAKEFAD